MVKVTKFNNMRGGISEEYKSERRDTLAYVDLLEDDRAALTVFIPALGTSRTYAPRPVGRVRAILERHLTRQGYAESDGALVFEWFDITSAD